MKQITAEWEVSKTDPISYQDVDNLPLPRVQKSFGLLKSDLRPVPAKMADRFGKRTSLLCCGGTSCSMGKCSPRPQCRKLTSVMNDTTERRNSSVENGKLAEERLRFANQRLMRRFLSERLV